MKYYLFLFYVLSHCISCQSNTPTESISSPKSVPPQAPLAINVSLNMTQPNYKIGMPITLRFVLQNNATENVRFCSLNSPAFPQTWTNCFRIKDSQGKVVPFIGKTASYKGTIEEEHFITMESKAIKIYTIDIRTLYQLNRVDTYSICFIGDKVNLLPNSLPARFSLKAT